MPQSFKITVGITGFFWVVFLLGVYAALWCDVPEATAAILFAGPVALIGTISAFVEWFVWRDNV